MRESSGKPCKSTTGGSAPDWSITCRPPPGARTRCVVVWLAGPTADMVSSFLRGVSRSAPLARAEGLVDRIGERPGMGCEALVVPWEAHRGDAKAAGQHQRGQVGHLAGGGIPGPHHNGRRGRQQGGNVGDVADAGARDHRDLAVKNSQRYDPPARLETRL